MIAFNEKFLKKIGMFELEGKTEYISEKTLDKILEENRNYKEKNEEKEKIPSRAELKDIIPLYGITKAGGRLAVRRCYINNSENIKNGLKEGLKDIAYFYGLAVLNFGYGYLGFEITKLFNK